MKNPNYNAKSFHRLRIRSGFSCLSVIVVFGIFLLLIGMQDEDSGGMSGTGGAPQRRSGTRSLARKSTAV
ncbi:hypothetical protein D9X91_07315 [Falsibacillus albus]|uniref:Uncharacterized protein n=1 Tax=Falsibacillus albus TaxID=2478915 RepID=A0A3L7K0H9_9BACI|nr:hypothetical protein D9X91_07315 [Falsibacillus albus]